MPEPVLPGDVVTERGVSLPCGCDAHTLLHEMLADLRDEN
jgi:hypothetical protein